MNTKSSIIKIATALFQSKGYLGVGLNEILKACDISKGSLYHHFPNGKEELLVVCIDLMTEEIATQMEDICNHSPSTQTATQTMIEKMVTQFDREGIITGYTFSSIVSEMGSLSEPVRNACDHSFKKIHEIHSNKLMADGFSKETANSIALMITASIEGGIILSLTQKSSEPLKQISQILPKLLRGFKIND